MDSIDQLLSGYGEEIIHRANELRNFLSEQLPEIKEEADFAAKLIGFNYGPGYKHTICVIILSKNGIKLGFTKGSELPDPHQILTGLGKVHRFVEIKNDATIHSAPLKKLIKEALKAYRKREG